MSKSYQDEWLDALDKAFESERKKDEDWSYDPDEQDGLTAAEKIADRHAWEVAGLARQFDGAYDDVDERIQFTCLSSPIDLETGRKVRAKAAAPSKGLHCMAWTPSEREDGSFVLAPKSAAGAARLEKHSHLDETGLGPMALTDLLLLVWPDWERVKNAIEQKEVLTASGSRRCIQSASHGKDGSAFKLVGSRSLPEYSHWALCTERMTPPFIAVDVDSADAVGTYRKQVDAGVVPECSFFIANHLNGHAQFFWLVPPTPRRFEKGLAYRAALENSLELALGGDPMFVGNRCQNPYWADLSKSGHDVYVPDGADGCRLWTQKAMENLLRAAGSWHPFKKAGDAVDSADDGESNDVPPVAVNREGWSYENCGYNHWEPGYGSGLDNPKEITKPAASADGGGKTWKERQRLGVTPRVTMLDRIRQQASDSSDQYDGSDRALNPAKVKFIPVGERQHTLFRIATWLQWHEKSLDKLSKLNMQLCGDPLPEKELKRIRKSVRSYYEKHHGKHEYSNANRGRCELAVMFGRRGGLAKTKLQVAIRNSNLRSKREAMISSGMDSAREAWRLVMVEGKSKSAASRDMGVTRQAVSGMLSRMETKVRDHVVRKAAVKLGWPTADLEAVIGADWAVVAVVRAGALAVAAGEATGQVKTARKALRDASIAVAWLVARCAPRVDPLKLSSKLSRAGKSLADRKMDAAIAKMVAADGDGDANVDRTGKTKKLIGRGLPAVMDAGSKRLALLSRRVDSARLAAEVASTAEAARKSKDKIARAVEVLKLAPRGAEWVNRRGLARTAGVLREIAHLAWLDDINIEPRVRLDEDWVVRAGEPGSGVISREDSWPVDELGAEWLDSVEAAYAAGAPMAEPGVDPLRPIRVSVGDESTAPYLLDYDYGYGEPDPEWGWVNELMDDLYLQGKLDVKPTAAEVARAEAIKKAAEARETAEEPVDIPFYSDICVAAGADLNDDDLL